MRPEIEAYLRDNGAQYTTEALRKQLIHAGYDPAEIDAALLETEVGRGPQLAETRASRSRYWWSAVGLHLAALVLVSIWVLTRNYTYGSLVPIVLGVCLLIGLGISGLIGRAFLPRTGLAVALIVPVISALGLGGICLGMTGGFSVQIPPRAGVMNLEIDAPLSFAGSGVAECYLPEGGFTVYAPDLGTHDGRLVSASLSSAGDPSAQASAMSSFTTVYLNVNLIPRVGTGGEAAYVSPEDATFELDAPSDGLSGTLRFEGLEAQLIEPLDSGVAAPDPISGTLSWTCE
ncbi:MAG: hypothetical protein M3P32_06250 [Chloroflexota bacterium]|nr:hypothetical protein [Chloroflexota bacterium]